MQIYERQQCVLLIANCTERNVGELLCTDAGLLSCQGRADRQWQSSCSVTGPATQAWFTVIAMMEDEDIEVLIRLSVLLGVVQAVHFHQGMRGLMAQNGITSKPFCINHSILWHGALMFHS